MRELALPRGIRARIAWEIAIARIDPIREATRTAHVAAMAGARVAQEAVTVEWHIPHGPRSSYALVAFAFEHGAGSAVQIEVPFTTTAGEAWTSPLLVPRERAWIGLPEEYVDAVLEAARACAIERLPPGRLALCAAAHGEVSSSRAMFRAVTRAALALLSSGPVADDAWEAVFTRAREA